MQFFFQFNCSKFNNLTHKHLKQIYILIIFFYIYMYISNIFKGNIQQIQYKKQKETFNLWKAFMKRTKTILHN